MNFQRNVSPERVANAPSSGEKRQPGWRRVAAAVGIGTLAMVPAAAHAAPPSAAAEKPTIKVALTGDIDSLNPFLSVLATSSNILTFQYEPLVQYGAESNEAVPGMADSWTTSPDGKAWTFTLPEDAKWSDGEAITSEDVKWTYDAVKTQDPLKQANGALLDNVVSVDAPNETTVVINLEQAQAPNPGTELPIVPAHVWKELPDPAAFENSENTVGSGPFIITKYDKNSGIQLKTNENYRNGAAKVAGVTYVPYKNSDAAVQALKTGEVDVVSGLTPAQYQALQSVEGITTNAGEGRRYSAVGINPGAKDAAGNPMGDGHPALHDKTVRQAIARAIDSKVLLEKVIQGLGTLGTGEVPKTYPLYHWEAKPEELTNSYDPAAANKMLDDAGYAKGADGIRVDKEGRALNLRLMGRSTNPSHQQMADFIKPWLKEIGINATVEMKSSAQVNDESTLGNYDLYFTGWGLGPDPDFQLSINQCSSRPNSDGTGSTSESNWCSEEFDSLYKAQHVALDQKKRSELVTEAQKLIYEAAPNKVLFYENALEAYRSDRFTGFVKQPTNGGVIMGQNGPWGLHGATPVVEASQASQTSDSGTTTWWIVGGLVVAVAIAAVVIRRKNATADERE
ncbi:ABC transporter substrate-binding protein [Paenarthrobacter sp. OM7]|uniref:ABC transporter substrate-binding protein n=1 Tax=Paenarthrobacter sp. AMU7 TaxID=3162492 RepID=A0AB39YM73_9MICC|nr:ABC transporter substrate-binding protein [Paenarthrobacter sp. OM7]WGM20449.1 ABC transporter substrate-binding protein [Paenarthrobacter sp. OM7]